MGCNSHLYIEYRPTYGNKTSEDNWFPWAKDISESRHYRLYGYLAGVRDTMVHPVVKRRGLPQNLSEELAKEITDWGTDGHSHTWLHPEEFFEAYALALMAGEEDDYSLSQEWKTLKDVLKVLEKRFGNENVRLIIFFDS